MSPVETFAKIAREEHEDESRIRILGEIVGQAIARGAGTAELSAYSNALAGTPAPSDTFEDGYRTSLHDVLIVILMQRQDQEARARLVAMSRDPDWMRILMALRGGPMAQRDLGGLSSAPTISRTLARMRAEGVIERWPAPWKDARERPHRLTPLGEELAMGLRRRRPNPPPPEQPEVVPPLVDDVADEMVAQMNRIPAAA